MNVLVTGGAGYIGSHAVRKLLAAGHRVTVYDSLIKGHHQAIDPRAAFVDGDIGDPARLTAALREHNIEAVLHFAAFIEVGESVKEPAKYYRNNFSNALTLLESMRTAGVSRIVFSSTAAVYGNPERTPIDEDDPKAPVSPYGRSKLMTEWALADYAAAHGFGYVVLRYFNVAGASPDAKIGEAHEPETHLIPRILLSAAAGKPINVFGTDYPTADGTCVRDYVHVEDLVDAHVLALNHIRPGEGRAFNLGSEKGFSVREVIDACRRVTGLPIEVVEGPRRGGDPAVLIAGSARARKEMSWSPKYPDLETIVRHAWNWHRTHPNGYEGVAS